MRLVGYFHRQNRQNINTYNGLKGKRIYQHPCE